MMWSKSTPLTLGSDGKLPKFMLVLWNRSNAPEDWPNMLAMKPADMLSIPKDRAPEGLADCAKGEGWVLWGRWWLLGGGPPGRS